MATASAGAASTLMGAGSNSTMGCIDTRLLGKPDKFDGQDSCWRDWKFITKTYIHAALPDIRALLLMAEETTDDVRNIALTVPQQGLSVQLYYMLALLTKNRALDKVQAAGEGEGLAAWRGLQEQWEPKSRSRFTSMLLGILNGRFKGDAQNDIESWERDIRSFEKQTNFDIPDFVKAGILINGLQEEPLRRHMVLHTSRLDTYEKLRLEVTEIARAKIRAVNPVPMEVDSLRFKGKGKGKSKEYKEKGKLNQGKGAHGKSPDAKEMECYYCGKKGHKKSECWRRKSDLEKAKSEGRPAVPPQSVHTIHEVGHSSSSSSTVDDARSPRGTAGISVIRTTPGEVAYIWVLSVASVGNKCYMKGIMLDSGAAVNVCPVDYFPEYGIQSGRHIELQGADGSSVEHYGSRDVLYKIDDEVMKIHIEVTSVKGPIVSLAALEDAGWRLGHQGNFMGLRRGDLLLRVDRVDIAYWLFGLEGLDKDRCDLVADRICGLEEIGLEQQQVRRPELLPEEHHIQLRSKPLPKEPSDEERHAHELTHLPARSCVKSFGLDDPHRLRRGGRDIPEIQVDYMFMGRRSEKELTCALHAIDTEFLARMVIRADKGPIDFVISGILEFLGEIGRKRIVIRSDNESAVRALVQAVALHREDETVIEEIPVKSSQSIGCNEHDHFLVGGMARALRIDMEKRFGVNFLVLHAVYSWILRHSGWLLNRFCVGRDGYTAFQRYKGRTYNGEICDLFECVLFKVSSPEEAKLDDRFRLGILVRQDRERR